MSGDDLSIDGIPVTKYGHVIQISTELALDYGLITEEEARARGWTPFVPPVIPRRTRLTRAARSWLAYHRPRVHFGECDCECNPW